LSDGKGVLINGTYLDSPVGTGTWTRFLVRMLPRAEVWCPTVDYVGGGRRRYYSKVTAELMFQRRPARVRLHPYWAATLDGDAVLSILDLIALREMNFGLRHLHLLAAKRARALLTISRHSADVVYGALGRECTIVPPVPDEAFFAPVAQMPRGRLRVAYWGGLHPRKGLAPAIAALEATGLDLALVCAGAVRQPAASWLTTVEAPSTSELVEMVDSCGISIYPSAEEGFGLPVYESLLRGKPAVVRDLPVYREFVQDPKSALVFVRGNSPAEWKDALIRAAELSADPLAVRSSLVRPHQAEAEESSRRPLMKLLTSLSPGG
jgi:glycosyltransferase involved in cell wall biosynthesis